MFDKRKSNYSLYSPGRKRKDRIIKLSVFLLTALITYEIITTFIITTVIIQNNSMNPQFQTGDRLLVLNIAYPQDVFNKNFTIPGIGRPMRGDITIYTPNFSRKLPWYLVPLNSIVRFFSFQKKSILINREKTDSFYVKRISGLPGDLVRMRNNILHIKPSGGDRFLTEFELTDNSYDVVSAKLPENWNEQHNPFKTDFEETRLKENEYFIISDNRYFYPDSRNSGFEESNSIKGKIILRYWPLKQINAF